jgi:hypothetical protein
MVTALPVSPEATQSADRTVEMSRRIKDEQRPIEPPPDEVETGSRDSFPASDAPSWTPVTGFGAPKRDLADLE